MPVGQRRELWRRIFLRATHVPPVFRLTHVVPQMTRAASEQPPSPARFRGRGGITVLALLWRRENSTFFGEASWCTTAAPRGGAATR